MLAKIIYNLILGFTLYRTFLFKRVKNTLETILYILFYFLGSFFELFSDPLLFSLIVSIDSEETSHLREMLIFSSYFPSFYSYIQVCNTIQKGEETYTN